MDMDVINYIKAMRNSGSTDDQIAEALKQAGHTQEQIQENFTIASQPTIATPPAPKPSIVERQEIAKPSKKMDITKAFVVIGSILVSLAVVLVVFMQWATAGPLDKILFLTTPTIIFFLIYHLIKKYENYKDISEIALGLALILLPISIGTIIAQSLHSVVTPIIVFWSSTLSLIAYITYEFALKKYSVSVLTIIAATVSLNSLLAHIYNHVYDSSRLYLWCNICFFGLLTGLGMWLRYKNSASNSRYTIIGTLVSLILITVLLFDYWPLYSEEGEAFLMSAISVGYLGVASYYYFLSKKLKDRTVYSLKRIIEEIVPITFLIPHLPFCFEQNGYSVMILALSIGFIFISTKIAINTLPYVGGIGVVVSIISISSTIFQNSFSWPVVLLITGFAVIGIGLLIKKVFNQRKTLAPATPLLGLGADLTIQAINTGHRKPTSSLLIVLALILIGPTALSYFISFIQTRTQGIAPDIPEYTAPQAYVATLTPTIDTQIQSNSTSADTSTYGLITDSYFDPEINNDPRFNPKSGSFNTISIRNHSDNSLYQFILVGETAYTANKSYIASKSLSNEIIRDYRYAEIIYSIETVPEIGTINIAKMVQFSN